MKEWFISWFTTELLINIYLMISKFKEGLEKIDIFG